MQNHNVDVTGLSHVREVCVDDFCSDSCKLLRKEVNSPFGVNGSTPLHLAVKNLEPLNVKILLEMGANPNLVDEAGMTPLHLACGIHEKVGEAILLKILKIRYKRELISVNEVVEKTMQICQQLIQGGSNVNARDHNGESPLFHVFRDDTHDYVARKFSRDTLDYRIYKDRFQRTKLEIMTVLKRGQCTKFKLLLQNNADVGIHNLETGDTILHKVFEDSKWSLFDDLVCENLISDILMLGLDVNAKNKRGETALTIATSVLNFNAVTVLRNCCANSEDIFFGGGFRYPKLLPSLKTVENLLEILEMRKNSLSEMEMPVVLKFLIDNNADCKYADPEDEDASLKLRNLLEFGTDENIIDAIEEMKKDDGYSRGIVNDQIGRYLVKLKMNDMGLNTQVMNCLNEAMTDTCNIPTREVQEIAKEVAKMRKIKLTSGRSLASILNAPPVEIFSLVKRGEHREILHARYLELKIIFRHYWGIITGFFAKFLIRKFVVKLLNEQIRFVSTKPLPDLCCENIAIYLSNEDLFRLYIANNVELPKEMETRSLADEISSNLKIV